jgi:hypothetical protein
MNEDTSARAATLDDFVNKLDKRTKIFLSLIKTQYPKSFNKNFRKT